MSVFQGEEELLPESRFDEGDVVKMSLLQNGALVERHFQINGVSYNYANSSYNYQLVDIASGKLSSDVARVREDLLKAGEGGKIEVPTMSVPDTSSNKNGGILSQKFSTVKPDRPLEDQWMHAPDEGLLQDTEGTSINIPETSEKEDRSVANNSSTVTPQTSSSSNRPTVVVHGTRIFQESSSYGYRSGQQPLPTEPQQDMSDTKEVQLVDFKHATLSAEVESFVDSGYASEDRKASKMHNAMAQVESSAALGDGTASVYSDQSSIASSFKDLYIAEIAADILEHLPADILSNGGGSMDGLYGRLPRLLKGFAVELADASRTQESRDAMVFISKHRQAIISQLRRLCESEAARDRSANWTVEEKIKHWQNAVSSDDHKSEEAFIGVDDLQEVVDEVDEVAPGKIPRHRDLVLTSPAHEWLIGRVEHELVTARLESSDVQPIGETILSHLSSSQSLRVISRSRNPGHCEARFQVSWDPVAFYESQGYDVEYSVFMRQAIALTGRENDAQAMTVSQYLHLCWPRVAEVLLRVLRESGTTVSKGKRVTLITLSYQQAGDQTTISVTGNAEAIAEVGEAVSWLSATLRSPGSGMLSYCRPDVVLKQKGPDMFAWDITCPVVDLPMLDLRNPPQGTCWTGLFQDPVLVRGFPILRKPAGILGLEIPLNVVTALVGSRRITHFAENLFVKGFSTALVLTKRSEHVCTWHLLFNKDEDHISYDDPRVRSLSPVKMDASSIHGLDSARHIVGWCSNIRSLTGSPQASYDIGLTKLPRPKPGFAFEKVSISGGKFVSAGLSFSVSKKDKPIHIKARDDYIRQLKWISKKYVVLYDVEDRRGWLVNGVSALLHLVRASLKDEQNDDFSDSFMFRPEQLREADESRVGKHAAIFVLTQAINQNLPLHKNADDESEETTIERGGESSKSTTSAKIKSTHYRLRNRVEEIYHLLEQIIAYQSQASSEDGIAFKVRASPRERLEGFDFMDVATDEDPFWPCVTTLRSTGKGWVDFIREIQAITLFGRGFGQLLKPTAESGYCQQWKELPTGEDHLAASVSDLNDILDKWGNKTPNLWQLVDNVYWHNPDKLFEACQCKEKSTQRPCDRVQVLLPANSLRVLAKKSKSPAALEKQGAVIFGYSRTLPLKWNERGEVKEGHSEDSVKSLHDHDLGSETSSTQISDINLTLASTPAANNSESSQPSSLSNDNLASGTSKRSNKESRFFRVLRH